MYTAIVRQGLIRGTRYTKTHAAGILTPACNKTERMTYMKKILFIALSIFCIFFAAGCNGNTVANTSTNTSAASSSNSDDDTPDVSKTAQSQTEKNTQASTSNSTQISTDEAKKIALENAGVQESDAVYVNAKLDYDDGKAVYDVEFYSGSTEYDYEIDASTGAVLSYDHDIENSPAASASSSGEVKIDLDTAKATALKQAGLSEGNVTMKEAKLEYDDGKAVYQIEFFDTQTEYDYKIDASSGAVLEFDKESIYD